jgi:hypothetical protein
MGEVVTHSSTQIMAELLAVAEAISPAVDRFLVRVRQLRRVQLPELFRCSSLTSLVVLHVRLGPWRR